MKLYDLCIVINHPTLEWNGKFAIIIEDDSLGYFIVELWTFDINREVEMKTFLSNNLRLATEEEIKEYQVKFKEYCYRNESP